MEFVRRFFTIPEQSFFLFGPRGTGKSTWLQAQLPDSLYLDLLEPRLHRSLVARPERLREVLAGSPRAPTVVIDEIQRAPELLSVVHAVLEGPSPPRFVLTGSSARKLRRAEVNLLGGRALHLTLHPFMAAELPEFNLQRALRIGLVPLVVDSADPQGTLDAYASLYIDQEVRAEGLTRDVGAFARFLEAISFSHGGQLNVAAIARECEVRRKTVGAYVDILEDLLMAFRLPVFRKRAKRATVARDRLYLFDAGVFRSLRPTGPLDRPGEIEGQALEGLVAQHLRAWTAYAGDHSSVYFWRTRAGTEVDFVVYGQTGFHAFEIKSARHVHASDLRGLRAFRADYPEADGVLLYRGTERLKIDGIWCLPVEDFLQRMVPTRGLLDLL
ncbi:MAG: ATP-binding protein [Gemmatimonadetes bacterium]|nr:ATP-binding protein [Gemmatimonadota bacterium]MYG23795.1 ATP-binding protein [Gemmatimonadota bacterium]MYJ40334.1 ATP-binding protein [Gemmatimonadota bacterium]